MEILYSELEIDCSRLDDHPQYAVRFFKIMMRLEYALKELGFAKSNGRHIRLDRKRYVKEKLGQSFLLQFRENKSLVVLLHRPPSYQIIKPSRGLSWEQANPIKTTTDLLYAVWRVRNNLFHGGKSGDPDYDRNDELIQDSITVISKILQQDHELHNLFGGRY